MKCVGWDFTCRVLKRRGSCNVQQLAWRATSIKYSWKHLQYPSLERTESTTFRACIWLEIAAKITSIYASFVPFNFFRAGPMPRKSPSFSLLFLMTIYYMLFSRVFKVFRSGCVQKRDSAKLSKVVTQVLQQRSFIVNIPYPQWPLHKITVLDLQFCSHFLARLSVHH